MKHWTEMEIEFIFECNESACFVLIRLNNLKHSVRLISALKLKNSALHTVIIYYSVQREWLFPWKALLCVYNDVEVILYLGNEYQNVGSNPGESEIFRTRPDRP